MYVLILGISSRKKLTWILDGLLIPNNLHRKFSVINISTYIVQNIRKQDKSELFGWIYVPFPSSM